MEKSNFRETGLKQEKLIILAALLCFPSEYNNRLVKEIGRSMIKPRFWHRSLNVRS